MSVRLQKISSLIRENLSLIFLQKVQDPELGLVTITNVKVSPDLKSAKVYLSVYEKEKRKYVLDHVESLKGYIRSELAHKSNLRNTPELSFFIDDTMDYVEHIDKLFKSINKNDKQNDGDS